MNYKRKEILIPTVIGFVIVSIVVGILIYRNFIRSEEWRLYDQIKSKPKWIELIYVKIEGDGYWNSKEKAFNNLLGLGKKGILPFIRLLDDNELKIKHASITTLGELGDKRAVEPLIKCLQGQDHRARRRAAFALGRLGDKRAIEPLIKCLHDQHRRGRDSILEALKKLGYTDEPTDSKPCK